MNPEVKETKGNKFKGAGDKMMQLLQGEVAFGIKEKGYSQWMCFLADVKQIPLKVFVWLRMSNKKEY